MCALVLTGDLSTICDCADVLTLANAPPTSLRRANTGVLRPLAVWAECVGPLTCLGMWVR